MNIIILALIFSFGCMFFGWKYYTGSSYAKTEIKDALSDLFFLAVAIATLLSGGALILAAAGAL